MTLLARLLRGAAAAGGIRCHLGLLTAQERSRYSPCSEHGRQRTWALIRRRLAELRRRALLAVVRELTEERVERLRLLRQWLGLVLAGGDVPRLIEGERPASWPAAAHAPPVCAMVEV